MAETSRFEDFVNLELPLRVSSRADGATLEKGLIAVTTGAGLEVEFLDKEEIAIDGKSAYDIAVEQGFVGNEAAWLLSLKGADGEQGEEGPMGQGIVVVANISQLEFDEIVAAADSEVGDAYLVDKFMYVFNGADWVKSNDIQGPAGRGLNYLGVWPDSSSLPLGSGYKAGDTYVWKSSLWTLMEEPERKWIDIGVPGPAGKSAYQSWIEAGNSGSEAEFLTALKGKDGTNGQSAYQIWVAQGGVGNEAAFIKSLEGKSAYQVWLAQGGVGNEQVYIASLKGEEGDIGPDGKSAYQLAVEKGFVGDEAAYLASLKGPIGDPAIAFTIAGKLTSEDQLPKPGEPTKAYYVGKDLYVWIAADAAYENFGSLNGDSAYQIALANGYVGTQVEWLASLHGTNGKSAYEIAVAQGYVGSEAAWLISLKGKDGTNGTNGTNGKNLQIRGTKANQAAVEAIVAPVEQEAWVTADNGHLFIYSDGAWQDLGLYRGSNGKSAYQIAKDLNPAIGTEAEWVASLKGKDGTNGTNGKSAYDLAVAGGFVGTEPEWRASLKGDSGKNLQISGSKANLAAIQAIVSPKDQEAWVTLDTGRLYIYVGAVWVDAGRFRGTDGTNGTNGTNGQSAYELWIAKGGVGDEAAFLRSLNGRSAYQIWLDGGGVGNEAAFIASLKGERGTDGTNGTNGRNVVIKGSVADKDALPLSPQQQDAYTVLDTLHLYMYIGAVWVDLGQFKGDTGEQGEEGPRGQGINIVGEVELVSELPDASTLNIGDAYYVVETTMLYQVNDAGVYGNGITIVGPEGPEGPQGIQGETGTSIKIMGSFATAAALAAAVPTGVAGEGYLVGPDLYLWGIDPTAPAGVKWYNAGPVRGPVGPEGPIGKTGLRGSQGKEGERGSLWLTLPVGVDQPGAGDTYGRIGDWAVNSSFNAFYRDPVQGWIDFGQIVAGDVNSPLAALGKVVREGTKWVPLPIDEVPSPVEGTSYLRRGIAGGKTQWVGVIIPDTIAPNVPLNTTKPQGLTSAGWVEVAPSASDLLKDVHFDMVSGVWTKSIIQVAPTVTLKPQCYQVSAAGVGSWVPVSFDSYSVLVSTTASAGAFTPNFANQQAYRVSTASAPVITLPAFTTGRAMLAVFTLEGSANKASFIAGSGATIGYSGGIAAADIEYGATQTVITAFWNGFGTWIISKGPAY